MSELIERPESQVPAFMAGDGAIGTEGLIEIIQPPRIKIVQKAAGSDVLGKFDVGDIILSPQMIPLVPIGGKLAQKGPIWHFCPIFYYLEWCLWNPIELKGNKRVIEERTCDPASPMVTKARDPKLRAELIPGEVDEKGNPLSRRYVEHINFVSVFLDEHDIGETPIVLSFSRGDHFSGSNFAALIKMRQAAIFGCRFQANAALRPDPRNDWYGIDVENPSDRQPWVTADQYDRFKNLYQQLSEAHSKGILKTEYEEPESAEANRQADANESEF